MCSGVSFGVHSFLTLCLWSIKRNGDCYNVNHAIKILQRTYRKMTILWSFSYNSFEHFHGKKIWEPDNMTVLYPNWCYNELCLIGPLKVFF